MTADVAAWQSRAPQEKSSADKESNMAVGIKGANTMREWQGKLYDNMAEKPCNEWNAKEKDKRNCGKPACYGAGESGSLRIIIQECAREVTLMGLWRAVNKDSQNYRRIARQRGKEAVQSVQHSRR